MKELSEDEFFKILRESVWRTMDFVANLTEYDGGAVTTEYLLATEISRAFLSRGYVYNWRQGETRRADPALKLFDVFTDKGLQASI